MITYSQSYVTSVIPSIMGNINKLATGSNQFRLSEDTKQYLVEVLRRKVSTNFKTPMVLFGAGEIVPVFDNTSKVSSPLIVPLVEGGKIKATFNMYPSFKQGDMVDDLNLFYKLLIDATVQMRMYDNAKRYTTKTDYVESMSFFYENMFMAAFRKLINFSDFNREYEKLLQYAIVFYLNNVLLERPYNVSSSVAQQMVKGVDMDLVQGVFGDSFNSVKTFQQWYDALKVTLFKDPNVDAGRAMNANNFVKEFAIMYPNLIFGIDMIQVMTGGIFSYLKAKSFDATYARLNALLKKNKNASALLGSILSH